MRHDYPIHVIASNSAERAEQARTCYASGFHAEIYGSYQELLADRIGHGIILAEDMVDHGGVEALMAMTAAANIWMPLVAMSSDPRPHRIVQAMRGGALDYLQLPLDRARLLETLERAVEEARRFDQVNRQALNARTALAKLTQREREVLDLLVAGSSNKMIARDLSISPRTVEIHRGHMMSKLNAHHVADAIRLKLEADLNPGPAATMPPMAA